MKHLYLFPLLAVALPVFSQETSPETMTTQYDGSFEDATFALENAIVNRGLNVEYVSHVGDMLNRTGEDVGSSQKIFEHADIYLFCSAVESRKAMEADPLNIANCPYSVFVFENENGVTMGHRDFPEGQGMDDVEVLLSEIVEEAASF